MKQDSIRDLGDGLVLRAATAEDTEKLVAFHAELHREEGAEEPDELIAAWVRDLMSGALPTFAPGDFTLVEDTNAGTIVSSLCLISQTWSYGDVPFGVGRPELVGTHPDYRDRGLVRAQFEVIHEWSAERGEWVQAITGIPYFYRQFGYEMAVTLGGSRLGYKLQLPKLKEGTEEPYRLRPAVEADLAFIAGVYAENARRYPVRCVRDEALWHYQVLGKDEKNVNHRQVRVIEALDTEPVGFVAHSTHLWQNRIGLTIYELKPGVSWLAVTPAVVRALWALGEEIAARDPKKELECFAFWLGAEHPAYEVFSDRLPHTNEPYTWYLRLADLRGFLAHVGPELERRLASSLVVGYTGELKLSFYRHGLRLAFEDGRLETVEPWQPTVADGGNAAFPNLTFLQLLFGYRSLADLRRLYPDCWTDGDEPRALLEALFPKAPSDIWPIA